MLELFRAEDHLFRSYIFGEVTERDASEELSPVVSVRPAPGTVRVLERTCRGVVIEHPEGTDTSFFDPKGPRVDPAAFARHAYGAWNRYLDAAKGALALKMRHRPPKIVIP